MPSTITDRLNGLSTSTAVKSPCRVATTAAITLSGTQTIDGVAVVAGDRVLVKNQTSAVDNGIWIVGAGTWARAADFDGSFDAVGGTMVKANSGTVNADTYWEVDGNGPLVIGTDAITITPTSGNLTLQADLASTASGKGASLISLTTGESVETALQLLKEDVFSIAEVCARGSSGAISAANKTAVQTMLGDAVTANKAVLIPSGDWYIDGGISCLTGLVPIICEGNVYTNTTTAFITMKAIGGAGTNVQNFFIRGGSFTNLDGTQAQKSSSIIKFQSDGALILYPEFREVEGYGFYQMFDDDAGSYTTGFGEESRMNHGLSVGCVPHYHTTLNAKYCFRRRTGSGTGWTYRDCRDDLAVGSGAGTDPVGTELIGYPAYVRIEGGAGYVVGDILIDGHFSGLEVGAISIDGDNAYQSNVSMAPTTQIDAQAKRAIFYDPEPGTQPVINLTVEPCNIGGDIDLADNFPMAVGTRMSAQGYGIATGGRYDAASLATGANSLDLCSVKLASALSCEVEIWMTGVVNGVDIGLRKQVFSVRHDSTTVTATEITALGYVDPNPIGANFFTAVASVASAVVTFTVDYTATSGGNTLQAQYRVTGGGVRVKRLS
jgi:hypothetical protein